MGTLWLATLRVGKAELKRPLEVGTVTRLAKERSEPSPVRKEKQPYRLIPSLNNRRDALGYYGKSQHFGLLPKARAALLLQNDLFLGSHMRDAVPCFRITQNSRRL